MEGAIQHTEKSMKERLETSAPRSADLALGYDYETSLPRVAVFPFCNETDDSDQDYFCEGIAAEILIHLARTPGLQVVARSSVSAYLGSEQREVDPGETGRRLNAKAILRGRVDVTDERLDMEVELLDAASGTCLWSETYRRDISEVFVVLDEIVPQIVLAMHARPPSELVRNIQSMHTNDIEAYEFYLRGRKLYWLFGRHSVELAAEMFRAAIELDSSYALAYTGLADCFSYAYMYVNSTPENLQKAEEASRRSLELDPLLAEAYAARGVVLSLGDDAAASEAAFEKAIELDPLLFDAHFLFARFLFAQGQFERAVQSYLEANRTRPEDFQSLLLAAVTVEALGDQRHATDLRRRGVALVEKHLELNQNEARALYMGANGLVGLGETDRALKWLDRARALESEDPMLLYNAGCIYSLTGKAEEAVECLERAVRGGLRQKGWFDHDSDLDPIRNHPRFLALQSDLI
jgi:TolB-like protein/tetratricopeptide (TPR) repeat protein